MASAASCAWRSPTTCGWPIACGRVEAGRPRAPKRVRHAGEWVVPEPRRAPPGTQLRSFQDAMPRCADGSVAVLSGDGTERAMLIGQAPGWRKIATRMRFAHDAGKRLTGWLTMAGVSLDNFRNRWYVTSVSKCYPGRRPGLGRLAAVARGPGCLGTHPGAGGTPAQPALGAAGWRAGASVRVRAAGPAG